MQEHGMGGGVLTLEEYLEQEERSEQRHEFVAGRVYALAGTTARHNRILLNVVSHLRGATSGGCQPYAIDLKVRAARDWVYYPDVVVACGSQDPDATMIADPCLIVEVTSQSTKRVDRGEKLTAYLALPSLRGYVIAEQDRRHLTVYARDAEGEWERHEIVGTGLVRLPCTNSTLSMDDVYDGAEPPALVSEGEADS
jgi:Uma2 family endonuclease